MKSNYVLIINIYVYYMNKMSKFYATFVKLEA